MSPREDVLDTMEEFRKLSPAMLVVLLRKEAAAAEAAEAANQSSRAARHKPQPRKRQLRKQRHFACR